MDMKTREKKREREIMRLIQIDAEDWGGNGQP